MGILSVIFYWIIVVYIWIPNLPPKYRSLGPEYSNPIFLVSVMSTVFLCLFYGIQLSICKTEIKIDKINHTMIVRGWTVQSEKFFYNFSLLSDKPIQLIIRGYLPSPNKLLDFSLITSKNTRTYWGVFLVYGTDAYLIFKAYKKTVLTYASEISEILEINYVESQDPFYLQLPDLIHISNFTLI